MKHEAQHSLSTILLMVLLAGAAFLMAFALRAENTKKQDEAQAFVSELSDDVKQTMNNGSMADEEKERTLTKLFNKTVDTEWMGKFALGRFYRQLDNGNKEKYHDLYHDYLVLSYIPKFRDYAGRNYDVTQITPLDNQEYSVKLRLEKQKDSPSIEVEYRLRRKADGGFRIIDIIGEGVSLITTQRSDFGSMASKKGANHFVSKLEAKVVQLREAHDLDTRPN